MGRGNPNWIRAARERRELALRHEDSTHALSVGGVVFAALLGVAIAFVVIGIARSRSGEP
jgi:hypothetical protein